MEIHGEIAIAMIVIMYDLGFHKNIMCIFRPQITWAVVT